MHLFLKQTFPVIINPAKDSHRLAIIMESAAMDLIRVMVLVERGTVELEFKMNRLSFTFYLNEHVRETSLYSKNLLYPKLFVATCEDRHDFLFALWISA